MKWERFEAISKKVPVLVMENISFINIKSANTRIRQNVFKVLILPKILIARKVQTVYIRGIATFKTINPVIVTGLKTVKKQRTHSGSNELTLATFPIPKNPTNINTI